MDDRNETVIRVGDEPVTVINVFDVDAARRAAELVQATPHVYSVVSVHHVS
jgi:hypothetical protein